MNGSIAFARTLRALDADDFRGSRLGLFVAVVLFAVWIWWSLAARVPVYTTAENARLLQDTEAGVVLCECASSGVRAGQAADVRFADRTIHARVLDVTGKQVKLRPDSPLPVDLHTASVSIEMERVSPARIVLRTLGRGNS